MCLYSANESVLNIQRWYITWNTVLPVILSEEYRFLPKQYVPIPLFLEAGSLFAIHHSRGRHSISDSITCQMDWTKLNLVTQDRVLLLLQNSCCRFCKLSEVFTVSHVLIIPDQKRWESRVHSSLIWKVKIFHKQSNILHNIIIAYN